MVTFFLIIAFFMPSRNFSAKKIDEIKISQQIQKIVKTEKQLKQELQELQNLFSLQLDSLKFIEGDQTMSEKSRTSIEKGMAFFKEKKFEWAKEEMQKAWEDSPDLAITSYNLGLIYYHLGNIFLAKKMFASALRIDGNFKMAQQVKEFLNDDDNDDEEIKNSVLETPYQAKLANLKNSIQSYLKSKSLSRSEKMKSTIMALESILEIIGDDEDLIKNNYMQLAEDYAIFEWYEKSLELIRRYESNMLGEILPENFHFKKLSIEEKKKQQDILLAKYLKNIPQENVKQRLSTNIEELEIFAVQFDQFVKSINNEDEDFIKITKRLKEFKWGNKPNRHVIIANIYEEIIFSSLLDYIPIEQYRDQGGRQFLRDIILLKNKMELKQVEFVQTELPLGTQLLPYIIMYTYIPKHKIFIIVKIPMGDLVWENSQLFFKGMM